MEEIDLNKNFQNILKDTKDFILDLDLDSFFLTDLEDNFFKEISKNNIEKNISNSDTSKNKEKPFLKKPTLEKFSPLAMPIKKVAKTIDHDKIVKKEEIKKIIDQNLNNRSSIKKNCREDHLSKENISNNFIHLEKPKIEELSLSEVKKSFSSFFPNIKIIETIPNDSRAKEISNSWKMSNKTADVIILSHMENSKERLFLEHLKYAISSLSFNVKIISANKFELENKWGAFLSKKNIKLIIAVDYSIWSLTNLMKFYKEKKENKMHYLNDIMLYMLPEISLYFKEPMLKKSLWLSITKILANFEKENTL